ncbi:MAG: aspartate carbamoyltransferase catalytic subunit [Sulfitobacter sp.]
MSNRKDIDNWEGLLDPDETILWQGRPENGVKLEWKSAFEPFFFLFFTGFSVFWMIMASQAPGPFWMFGLLFFGVGMFNLVGKHFWKAYLRNGTFYTLTTKRAFIGTTTGTKRKLESYPIRADTTLTYEEGALSSIWFAQIITQTKQGSSPSDIGFERLADGKAVYAKFREVQRFQSERTQDTRA